jgi:hypothetical protein
MNNDRVALADIHSTFGGEENSGDRVEGPSAAHEFLQSSIAENQICLRSVVIGFLLCTTKGAECFELPRGAITEAAERFGVCRQTIARYWERFIVDGHAKSHRLGQCGRKRKDIEEAVELKSIPLSRRQNIRSVAAALTQSKSTVHRRLQTGDVKAHTNAIKPYLTDKNKRRRLEYALDAIDCGLEYRPNLTVVHFDEKWFYITKESTRYYLAPEETLPQRTAQSKRHIEKVMFGAAVARPGPDPSDPGYFDGKIGIWDFSETAPAQRSSANRPRGTMVTKPILKVNREVVKRMIIEKVFPAIRAKWPPSRSKRIDLQMDNARPHGCA